MKTQLVNGSLWNDINGEPIHAHGGHMLYHDGYYYWYGEDRRDDKYVSCYRSKDLFHWEFRDHILTTSTLVEPIRVRTKLELVNDEGGKVNLERPKVLFNPLTKKFVLWVHYENGKNYNDAACAVATSDYPDRQFVYHGSFNPYGYMSRDCTLFQDDDGTAYFISAARDNADLHIYRLQEDYLNVDCLVSKLWQGEYREAPAVFKRNGKYYMLTSFCTGWAPNQGKYAMADSMEGSWSMLHDFGDETTYRTQPAFVLKRSAQEYLYFSDRWNGSDYFQSSYVVLPIEFNGAVPVLNEYATLNLDGDMDLIRFEK
ncbi:family 43 glycosylhydrolase [Paenibacillus sp. ACRSA]|uniref:family 43 glycosylhydrolase n=1 Tax=Paenibacillus sp. ACRSA TaxID=2918211 RepID=UPI001EF704F3|nr:family 43 glycosylhydrolase [Paenibacillus sp. ACRSA]MCG7376243.1 family 43 glycosylhydrolase [Paenibacillus sp. ACRSA]